MEPPRTYERLTHIPTDAYTAHRIDPPERIQHVKLGHQWVWTIHAIAILKDTRTPGPVALIHIALSGERYTGFEYAAVPVRSLHPQDKRGLPHLIAIQEAVRLIYSQHPPQALPTETPRRTPRHAEPHDPFERLTERLLSRCPREAPCGLAACEAPKWGGCAIRASLAPLRVAGTPT